MQFPRILRPLYGDVLWQVKKDDFKNIYLTFDDGPVPEVTPQVLDILDEFGWKATFFCVGDNVRKYPDLYSDITARGHRVGNHSFNHLNGFKCSSTYYVENIRMASEFIDSKLFRPPYGRIRLSQLNLLKSEYKIIMWDLITHDYNPNMRPEKIFNIIRRNLRAGSVVVFHDSVKAKRNVLEVLPKALEYWKKQGYSAGLL